jgi:hypothetical protein
VRHALPLLVALAAAGCSYVSASEITVDAVNHSEAPMVIQIVEGAGPDAAPYGPPHEVDPGEEALLELAVPGGAWAVTVNGDALLDSSDAGLRRGRLPFTLILSPDGGSSWQAPADWAGIDP